MDSAKEHDDDCGNRTTGEGERNISVPYTVFEVLVAFVAIIGNFLVILVFARQRRLRRRTNYYIVSLAVADLLVGLLGIPFAIMSYVGLPRNLHACLFTVSLLVVLCTISIFCLVAVSVDRYWAILYPMGYSRNVRTRTAIAIIGVCWVAGTIVGFLPLFGWHNNVDQNDFYCYFTCVMPKSYLVFLCIATIYLPALIMLGFYAHIYQVVLKQIRHMVMMNPNSRSQGTMLRVLSVAQRREVKATRNLSIIVLFFIICWIPLYTINFVQAFVPDWSISIFLMDSTIILSHINSAINPLLYAYHLRDFRAAMKDVLCVCLGRKQSINGDLHRASIASNTLHNHVNNIRIEGSRHGSPFTPQLMHSVSLPDCANKTVLSSYHRQASLDTVRTMSMSLASSLQTTVGDDETASRDRIAQPAMGALLEVTSFSEEEPRSETSEQKDVELQTIGIVELCMTVQDPDEARSPTGEVNSCFADDTCLGDRGSQVRSSTVAALSELPFRFASLDENGTVHVPKDNTLDDDEDSVFSEAVNVDLPSPCRRFYVSMSDSENEDDTLPAPVRDSSVGCNGDVNHCTNRAIAVNGYGEDGPLSCTSLQSDPVLAIQREEELKASLKKRPASLRNGRTIQSQPDNT